MAGRVRRRQRRRDALRRALVASGAGWEGRLLAALGEIALLCSAYARLAELPAPLRPTLGIQLAPPVVGGVAYLSVTTGTPDLLAYAMLGYGVLQALLLLRLLP